MNTTTARTATAAGLALAFILSASAAQAQFTTQWQLGRPGQGWVPPVAGLGGPDVTYVREGGPNNALPGNPNNPAVDNEGDHDYYFAGTYNGPNSLNATVATDELAMERAFAGTEDNTLRIHFNLPASLIDADKFRFSFESNSLDGNGTPPRYGIEARVNGQLIMPEVVVGNAEVNTVITSDVFTAGDAGLVGGVGFDNVLELTGINHSAEGGGNWMGMDYQALEFEAAIPEPTTFTMLALASLLLLPLTRRKRSQK